MMNENINLEMLRDNELNKLIDELVSLPHESRTLITERMGFAASAEWRRRYPGTIAPAMLERAERAGGFPPCYTGPRETVKISE